MIQEEVSCTNLTPFGRVFKIRIIFMFKLSIKTPHNLL